MTTTESVLKSVASQTKDLATEALPEEVLQAIIDFSRQQPQVYPGIRRYLHAMVGGLELLSTHLLAEHSHLSSQIALITSTRTKTSGEGFFFKASDFSDLHFPDPTIKYGTATDWPSNIAFFDIFPSLSQETELREGWFALEGQTTYDRLKSIYEFQNASQVMEFVQSHQFLTPLLFETHSKIQRSFGTKVRVSLKMEYDPEIPNDTELFAYVHTNLSPKEALKKLSKLDEEWFLDQLDRTEGKFNINLSFA